MFMPLLVLPLAAQLIAASDAVPTLDVTPSCRGAARAGAAANTQERLHGCIEGEQRTRDQLSKEWSSFTVSSRMFCLASIKGFEPTYTELATCLEMRRALAEGQSKDAVPVAPVKKPGAFTTGSGQP